MKFELTKSKPTTIAGVKEVMQQIWNYLTAEYLRSLYVSMPRWMERVIKAEGGATKYWRVAMIWVIGNHFPCITGQ